ncbi:unnamed protein product [Owenia fusiformis]|uniref:Uncharacterized protein n=1 Tax=Owenia fusiformis TaxID=6347 RepID=A0A8J1XSH8_OWEFU|nr:unnamed protein product [Owenia fusiformis]
MFSTYNRYPVLYVLLVGCITGAYQSRDGGQFCPSGCHCTNHDIYNIDCSNMAITYMPTFDRLPQDVPISINMSHNRIQSIAKEDCIHLGQVIQIDLSYNELSHVHSEAFRELTNLKELLLHGNILDTSTFGISKHLPKCLESLSVDARILTSEQKWDGQSIVNLIVYTDDAEAFEPKYQQGLTRVFNLSIHGNNIKCIPRVIFEWESSKVINVELSGHKIKSLDIPRLSKDITIGDLKMNLRGNKISKITAIQTANYYQFQKVSLILPENDMDFIEEGIFPNISRFGVLDLSRNRLKGSDIIRLFKSIRDVPIHALLLNDNNIDLNKLNADIFEPLRNSDLHTLDLSKNHIHSIDRDVFRFLPHLRELIVSNLHQPEVFIHTNLKHLTVHSIHPRYVPELFASLPGSLQTLTISNIEDSYSSEKQFELKNAHNLQKLRIIDSPFQFSLKLWNLSTLSDLELTNSGIRLRGLDIDDAVISQLTEVVFRNEETFNGRDIITFFKMFDKGSALEVLDFSDNDWSILEDTEIQIIVADLELKNLKELRLSNCKLRDSHLVKNVFNGLPKVVLVDLSYNILGHLPNGIFNSLSSLRELYLQGNQLTFIDPNNFQHLPLTYVNVENNRFRCDCDIREFSKWMREFVKKNETALLRGYDSECKYPIALWNRETKVVDFFPNEILCDGNIFKITIPIIIFLIVIIITAAFVHHFWVEIKFKAAICYQDCSVHVFDRGYKGVPSVQFSFDAYVVHHDTDLLWVMDNLLPNLEESPDLKFTLCLEERNFIPGNWREDNILRAVQTSRKTILVISKALLQSSEGVHKLEIELATDQFYEGRRHSIIVIILDHCIVKKHLPKKLSVLLDYAVVLYWPRKQSNINKFWKELKLSLLSVDKYRYQGPLNHSHCTSETCALCRIDTSKLLILPDSHKGPARSHSSPS